MFHWSTNCGRKAREKTAILDQRPRDSDYSQTKLAEGFFPNEHCVKSGGWRKVKSEYGKSIWLAEF